MRTYAVTYRLHAPCNVWQKHNADVQIRGSKFLKAWMEFLEEHADLRYPNLSDIYVDERNAG